MHLADSLNVASVQQLVTRAGAGELLAWHELFHRFRDPLLRECVGRIPRHLRARFDPEDVVQAAFLSAFRHIGDFRYRGEGSFHAWLRTILDNALRDRIKHHFRAKRSPDLECAPVSDEDHRWPDSGADRPEVHAGIAEDQQILRDAVRRLPADLREIVELRTESGMTWNAIARRLGYSSTTVRRRVQAALQRLQTATDPRVCG